MMDPRLERLRHITRRHFFKESQVASGAIGSSSLLADAASGSERRPRYCPRIRSPRSAALRAEGQAASSTFT